MWSVINDFLVNVDNFVWGVPLMVLIMAGGLLLTVRLGLLQIRKLPLALKWMIQNEEEAEGEISSFAALCTIVSDNGFLMVSPASFHPGPPLPERFRGPYIFSVQNG